MGNGQQGEREGLTGPLLDEALEALEVVERVGTGLFKVRLVLQTRKRGRRVSVG